MSSSRPKCKRCGSAYVYITKSRELFCRRCGHTEQLKSEEEETLEQLKKQLKEEQDGTRSSNR